jgi:hypothetical protein
MGWLSICKVNDEGLNALSNMVRLLLAAHNLGERACSPRVNATNDTAVVHNMFCGSFHQLLYYSLL